MARTTFPYQNTADAQFLSGRDSAGGFYLRQSFRFVGEHESFLRSPGAETHMSFVGPLDHGYGRLRSLAVVVELDGTGLALWYLDVFHEAREEFAMFKVAGLVHTIESFGAVEENRSGMVPQVFIQKPRVFSEDAFEACKERCHCVQKQVRLGALVVEQGSGRARSSIIIDWDWLITLNYTLLIFLSPELVGEHDDSHHCWD